MMGMLRWTAFSCLMLLLLAAPMGAEHQDLACSAPREITRFKVDLTHTARAVRARTPLVIVAIGSSSTAGVGASDPAHSYPARLAEELQRRWPQLAITVINKGVGGELSNQMLARFERDVLPYHPQLVIWQTGSNRLLKTENVDGYTEILRDGVSRLKAAEADVVLMDPQFAPRLLARRMHLALVDSIAAVAKDTNVALFPRFAVMRYWVASGQYEMQQIVSSDGLHMNDVSYGCIASLLADSLVAAADSGAENQHRTQRAEDASR
jgi:acyl-CoA thioesterase I